MKLADLTELRDGDAVKLAEEIDGRLIDGRFLFNQKDTATLLLITPRAFADWPIRPLKTRGREKFFYWPDVRELCVKRLQASRR